MEHLKLHLHHRRQQNVQSGKPQTLQNNVVTPAGTMQIALKNGTLSPTVYAFITGLAIDRGNQLMLLSADRETPYYPPNPPQGTTVQPLLHDCAIALGPPGSSVFATIPHIAGCRVWFSVNSKLTFRLNPSPYGPALVEPSCTNPSDPDINHWWSFAELTFNADQCFANISYVDFVCLPMSVTLTTTDGKTDHVSGMATNALSNVCAALKAQEMLDGQPWSRLIVRNSKGEPLRVLSPNNAPFTGADFSTYFNGYVNQVYDHYKAQPLNVDTQARWQRVEGTASDTALMTFGDDTFAKPSTQDIFSCCTGPFGDNLTARKLAIIPRLSAAYNRGTLLTCNVTPDPQGPATFYKSAICNHYSRIVHEQCLDGRGYAFPYDDVCADGGPDQCGAVYDGKPKLLTIAVGGNAAYVSEGAFGAPTYN
ncbi:hypothetical protein EG327_002250 [Venturia inaequalis]|uniref:GH64 domain-containing protein n=1 Tax=Venturia inaequalis TaxID=5025 RepID=A0A8H3ZB41_VENIN|nr:hypothetical protein EG327_002250 [Venturia inaequalis]